MDACIQLPAEASRVDIIHSGFGVMCRGIAGFASELRNHLIVEHAAQLLKDQLKHYPSTLPLQPLAEKKPTALLSKLRWFLGRFCIQYRFARRPANTINVQLSSSKKRFFTKPMRF